MDIRRLGKPIAWPNCSRYCFFSVRDPHTPSGYRVYVAKVGVFKVLGSFPTMTTAARVIAHLKRLEEDAAQAQTA